MIEQKYSNGTLHLLGKAIEYRKFKLAFTPFGKEEMNQILKLIK